MKAVRSNFVPFERNQLRFASRFGALVGVRVVGLRLIFNIEIRKEQSVVKANHVDRQVPGGRTLSNNHRDILLS